MNDLDEDYDDRTIGPAVDNALRDVEHWWRMYRETKEVSYALRAATLAPEHRIGMAWSLADLIHDILEKILALEVEVTPAHEAADQLGRILGLWDGDVTRARDQVVGVMASSVIRDLEGSGIV